MKVFSSPGVCSRPLNTWERFREWWVWSPSLLGRSHDLVWRWKNRKHIRDMQLLLSALSPSKLMVGEPLQVEDLRATMALVTYDDRHLRLK